MKDVQSEKDLRNIPINKVGITNLNYPITVMDRSGNPQHTVAGINMTVDLPHHYRGTHMSRFLEVLARHSVSLKLDNLGEILRDMKKTFKSQYAHINIEFPYFLMKKAPVSGMESPMGYTCGVNADMGPAEKTELTVNVTANVHSLCPCSKEISENNAHNQRGQVRIRVKSARFIWFEDLIALAEGSASAPLFTLLKRSDEKWITEHAYQNPRFVEDTARDVAVALKKDPRVEWFSVEVRNFESIHNHDAVALITSDGRDRP